ncbi:putative endonuclease [Plesiocystis pacifica SIR-1]|uniref:Endonuclease III n=1 Tax=Plesiocystis pacifica SIR-1 TaxID=391625 RepID=A6G2S7_9BACT|nr:endonuclease III [Plesiocystis pacifica]EDM79777.1 putative endonuclease [Plesiocystis pacifica SIR-1]
MRRADKAQKILAQLDELYPELPIPLDHRDAFTLLVAVLLSAQTTDARVNEVTPALFADGPDPATMAALPVKQILGHIKTLGLAPTKAKRVKALAQQLVDEHDGEVPQDMAALERLPGVGHKTASVVMAQAFGVPAFPVDTHIHRLAARWGLSNGTTVERTEADLKRLFPEDRWNDVHLQFIFFGREYCPALYHELADCPICGWAATKKRVLEERRANDAARREAAARMAKKKAAKKKTAKKKAAKKKATKKKTAKKAATKKKVAKKKTVKKKAAKKKAS